MLLEIVEGYFKGYCQDLFESYFLLLFRLLSDEFSNCNLHILIPFSEFLFKSLSKEKQSLIGLIFTILNEHDQRERLFFQMLRLFSESEFLTDHNDSGVNKFGY